MSMKLRSHRLSEEFTDRGDAIADFRSRLNWAPNEYARHVMYCGEGGIGKTAFRRYVAEEICSSPEVMVPYAVVDFETPTLRESASACLTIRRQLGDSGLAFPCFDLVWARYARVSGASIPHDASFWQDLAQEVFGFFAPIPGIAAVSRAICEWVNEQRVSHTIDEWLKSEKWKWFRDVLGDRWSVELKRMRVDVLLDVLPHALAADIDAAMEKPENRGTNKSCRVVIFFDGYEWLEQALSAGGAFVRILCERLKHSLIVICGRNPVQWGTGRLERYLPFRNFSPQESDEYLCRRRVNNSLLRLHLAQITDGFPFYLSLAADWHGEFAEKNSAEPDIAHLGEIERSALEEELLERLLREMPLAERHAALLAAIPRWFNHNLLAQLLADPATTPFLVARITRLSFCEPHTERPGDFIIRATIRRLLCSRAHQLPQWREWHLRLLDYHTQCEDMYHNSEPLRFAHALERVYHALISSRSEGWKIFNKTFNSSQSRRHIAQCRALLGTLREAFPSEQGAILYYEAAILLLENKVFEAIEKLEELLREPPKAVILQARIFASLGEAYYKQAYYEEALDAFEHSLSRYSNLGGRQEAWDVYNKKGNVHAALHQWERAASSYREGIDLCRRASPRNIEGEVRTLNSLGDALMAQLLEEKSKTISERVRKVRGGEVWRKFREALAIAGQESFRIGQALSLRNMARFCRSWEDRVQERRAIEYYQQSLIYSWVSGDVYQTAEVLKELGALWHAEDSQRASRCFEQSQQLLANLGHNVGEMMATLEIQNLSSLSVGEEKHA